jgi:hypothetical protein
MCVVIVSRTPVGKKISHSKNSARCCHIDTSVFIQLYVSDFAEGNTASNKIVYVGFMCCLWKSSEKCMYYVTGRKLKAYVIQRYVCVFRRGRKITSSDY